MSAAISPELIKTVAVIGLSVVVVPLFKRLMLGTVLAYLTVGLLLGPSVLGLFQDPGAVIHFAEIGVVMFLFIIGLEMDPKRLWAMRKAIFGRGLLQVVSAGCILTACGHFLLGLSLDKAFVLGSGFALSSTAIVMQVLEERGLTNTAGGQRVIATLLFEDLAIIPLLVALVYLSPLRSQQQHTGTEALEIALMAIFILIVSGRWLLNFLFRMISRAHVRELMTATALLVVLGAALLMSWGGLSMAMGAFAAGVMLSESSFRHQLEADIEPFRGLLLGLFFIGIGMSLDLSLLLANYQQVLLIVFLLVGGKALAVYLVALITRIKPAEALNRTLIMAHGGEFAFVLYANAQATYLITQKEQGIYNAAVILSMLISPLLLLLKRFFNRKTDTGSASDSDMTLGEVDKGRVLVLGFGRFNQIVCQVLLARGIKVTVIDNDAEKIKRAAKFGFKVYYGDGKRFDILRACGLEEADCVIIGIANQESTERIAEQIKHEYPNVKVLARTYDRRSALKLSEKGVDYHIRETFESALALGKQSLVFLGIDNLAADEVVTHVRALDQERFQAELLNDFGDEQMRQYWHVMPLVSPQQSGTAGNKQTEILLNNDNKG